MKLYVALVVAVLMSIADTIQPLESAAFIDINEGRSPSLQETLQSDDTYLNRVARREAGKPQNVPPDLTRIPKIDKVIEEMNRIRGLLHDPHEDHHKIRTKLNDTQKELRSALQKRKEVGYDDADFKSKVEGMVKSLRQIQSKKETAQVHGTSKPPNETPASPERQRKIVKIHNRRKKRSLGA